MVFRERIGVAFTVILLGACSGAKNPDIVQVSQLDFKRGARVTVQGDACILDYVEKGGLLTLSIRQPFDSDSTGLRLQQLRGAKGLANQVDAWCGKGERSKNIFQVNGRLDKDNDGKLLLVSTPRDIVVVGDK